MKPKYEDRAKLCYTDTDSFVIHIITEDFYKDISGDVKIWFDTSNYDENDKRPPPIGMNKRVYGFFKDELGGKIIKEFVALRAKTYACRTDDDDDEKKKAKGTKTCVIKHELMFENCKDCLFNGEVMNHSKDLKVIIIKCTRKKLIKLRKVVMMKRDYKHLIGLQHIHKEQQMKC